MNFLDFLIPAAHAQAAAPAPQGGGLSMLVFPIILVAVMYFMMIRPQMKRQKEHRALQEKLSRGDEVIVAGIAGVVAEIGENFITVEVAEGVKIRFQKSVIQTVLPKGTLKSAA